VICSNRVKTYRLKLLPYHLRILCPPCYFCPTAVASVTDMIESYQVCRVTLNEKKLKAKGFIILVGTWEVMLWYPSVVYCRMFVAGHRRRFSRREAGGTEGFGKLFIFGH